MLKLAAIIGGVLLMGGVAFAGTRTLLDQTTGPTLGTTVEPPAAVTTSPAVTTPRQDDRSRENEVRGRENEPGEDVRGPCDEAEHATDPRCTGAAVAPGADDDVADDRGDDNPGRNSGPSDRSGHEGGDDSSGHGGRGGDDDGDHSGHGGGGGDD
jgi:uncharacterized membrane protein YgcG